MSGEPAVLAGLTVTTRLRADPDVTPARPGEILGPLGLFAPAGILAGRLAGTLHDWGLGVSLAWPSVVAAIGALVSAELLLRRHLQHLAAGVVLLSVVLVTVAGVFLRLETHTFGLVAELVDRGGTLPMGGSVALEPRLTATGWNTVIGIRHVDGRSTRERAVTVLDEPLALGERIEIVASARPLPDGGYGRWLAQAHAVAVLDLHTLERTGDPPALARASEWMRARIRKAATRHQDVAWGGLLVGFVVGDTRMLPEADVAAMQATGLSHLTAVSGSNTAILLGGVAGALTLLRVHARLRWALLALTVPWFAFLTRLEPSVLRAGTMAVLVIAAAVHGIARDARHLLAGAVFLLVLADPMLTWSLGLVLSAGATLGVLVIAPTIAARFERLLPRSVAALLGITLGAQVAVAPVLLVTFGTVEWISVPANMLAVPVAVIGATLGFVGSAVAFVHVGAASSVFTLAGPAAGWVLTVARAGQRFTGGPSLPESSLVRAVVLSCLAVSVGLARWWSLQQGRARRATGDDAATAHRLRDVSELLADRSSEAPEGPPRA